VTHLGESVFVGVGTAALCNVRLPAVCVFGFDLNSHQRQLITSASQSFCLLISLEIISPAEMMPLKTTLPLMHKLRLRERHASRKMT